MKKKLLGIFVCMLLIATALPAVGTITEKETPTSTGMGGGSLSYQSNPRSIMSNNRGGMFIQLPRGPENPRDCYNSNSGSGLIVYEDFWDIPNSICDIHWWGFSMFWDGTGWSPCDPEGMKFDITFYYDDGTGKPGDELCSYDDVTYSLVRTGIWYMWYGGKLHEMLYFETQLDPCCDISDGWVSIQCNNSPSDCWFFWSSSADGNSNAYQYVPPLTQLNDDLAFILTDAEAEPVPNLECDGELSWTDVKPGDTVTGDFVVRNNGAPDSILHWKIESYPNWGNWKFTPNASILTIGAGWITVDVEVIAPDDPNEEFTGEVKLVNAVDSSDSCTIDVSLATPRNKAFNFNFPMLSWLFEQFPNAFPILRHMLVL